MDPELARTVMAVPLITGVVELLKRQGMPAAWAPLAAIVLGVALSLGYAAAGGSLWFEAVIGGLATGLGSMGLYSGVKHYRETGRENGR
ncbi:MAG TPA: hypothetical protein VIK92_05110 [Thermaerobacter sp.]